ncbi:anion permease [Escherichia coli]
MPISLLCYRYFAMLANVSGAPLMLTALALLFSNSYGGMVTHYGGAAGPVIFGVGYNDIKSRWLVGAVLTILTFPGAYHPRRVVVEYADRLEHAVNILVILQVACAASAVRSPQSLTYVSSSGIHSLVAFLQLELF